MTKKERALACVQALKEEFPDALCSLHARNAFELLVATRLSAQCTDARVNMVTPALFERFPDADSMAQAPIEEVEELIRTCGLYKTKAQSLVAMAQMLRDEFEGKVPDTIDELTRLPGIGRKTANLICGDIYGKPAVVADTHLIRITGRIGLVATKDPYKVEMELRRLLPPEESNDFCHRMVLFGRATCTARSPKCEGCCLNPYCRKILK